MWHRGKKNVGIENQSESVAMHDSVKTIKKKKQLTLIETQSGRDLESLLSLPIKYH